MMNLIRLKGKISRFSFGMKGTDGFLLRVMIYSLLIVTGFVFLYPVFYMLSSSVKSFEDLLNPAVNWVPTTLNGENYKRAIKVLGFSKALLSSIYYSGVPAILQIISVSIIGYGFARFKFPLKKVLFALMLITFIIPPQVTMIPTYLLYKNLGLLESSLSIFFPSAFGQGIKSTIFILIFYQFFRMIPKVLEEAASIDGAGKLKIFVKIAIPMSIPAYLISFLFSFVWYWNETYLLALFVGDKAKTLPLQLQRFISTYKMLYESGGEQLMKINEPIQMAGVIMTILPLLVIFFVAQRWFVESVDRSGITGE